LQGYSQSFAQVFAKNLNTGDNFTVPEVNVGRIYVCPYNGTGLNLAGTGLTCSLNLAREDLTCSLNT
jgi:hypothetical protein